MQLTTAVILYPGGIDTDATTHFLPECSSLVNLMERGEGELQCAVIMADGVWYDYLDG